MKHIYTALLALCAILPAHHSQAQCSGGTAQAGITPTATYQTVNMRAGRYRDFPAVAGTSYEFTFCAGGGSATFDTQITILTSTGAFAGGYNDDACGSASSLVWACTATGTYRVLVNEFNCTASAATDPMAYRSIAIGGPGTDCANPHIIPSLPFSATGLTTCGKANDYTSAHACTPFYAGGEDYIFRYIATGAQTIQVSLSNTIAFTAVYVTQGCPNGGTCIAANPSTCGGSATPNESFSGNPSATFNLPAAGTYYIWVDNWPTPNCYGFDINVQTATNPVSGPGCGAYTITTPAYSPNSYTTGTLLSFPDDEFSAAIPLPFTFCFMGTNYNSLVVSSNAYVTFNAACANQGSNWDTDIIPAPAATNSPEARNAIMFPWADVDPSVGGTIRYNTYGTAPNRRFVVAFNNVPMFDFLCNSILYTGQVVLYETSHVIDIYVQNYTNCIDWNNGEAVFGLLDASGTIAVPVPGFNNTVFSVANFARRFTPNCPSCTLPLPVSYASISGSRRGDHNLVQWQTSMELNTATFTLERSADGNAFQTVGTLQGAGTAPQGGQYAMEDHNPYQPATYYRVVQRDIDGTETASQTIMVSSSAQGLGITQVIVEEEGLRLSFISEGSTQAVNIEILDLLGKRLRSHSATLEPGSSQVRIPLSGLSPGAYIARATGMDGRQVVRKFVVQ